MRALFTTQPGLGHLALPGPEEAVGLLERLAREKRPTLAEEGRT